MTEVPNEHVICQLLAREAKGQNLKKIKLLGLKLEGSYK